MGWWETARKTANWLQGFLPLSLPPTRKARVVLFRGPSCGLMGAPVLVVERLLGRVGRVPRPGHERQLGPSGRQAAGPSDALPQPVTQPKPRPGMKVARPPSPSEGPQLLRGRTAE